MRTSIVAAVLTLGALAITGCTPADHSREANDLQDELRGLDGVATVALDYDEPELLDAADVNLDVTMRDDAMPGDIAAVFETAYRGLTDAHEEEEGNLTVTWVDDELTLRTFESEAEPADVADAAGIGAEVAADHRKVFVNVMTQDVVKAPHVESLALVRLPKGSDAGDRRRVHAAIAAAYGDHAVRVDVRISRR